MILIVFAWYLDGVTSFVARISWSSDIVVVVSPARKPNSFRIDRLTRVRINGGDALQTSSNICCEFPKNCPWDDAAVVPLSCIINMTAARNANSKTVWRMEDAFISYIYEKWCTVTKKFDVVVCNCQLRLVWYPVVPTDKDSLCRRFLCSKFLWTDVERRFCIAWLVWHGTVRSWLLPVTSCVMMFFAVLPRRTRSMR